MAKYCTYRQYSDAMKLNKTVRDNIAKQCPEAATVLQAAALILTPNGSFTHYPTALRVYGPEYEIGLKFLIDNKVVLVKAGRYSINRHALMEEMNSSPTSCE